MTEKFYTIKKNRTPKGDGNNKVKYFFLYNAIKIKKNRTPKGDGNLLLII